MSASAPSHVTPDRPDAADLRRLDAARRRVHEHLGTRRGLVRERERQRARRAELDRYLELAPDVEAALEALGARLFRELLDLIESRLTIALREVLEQPIRLRTETGVKHGSTVVEFHVEREEGKRELLLQGQGGSVTNIVSTGLRLFALTTLDPERHRRLLVLDEQDCWLRPDLVPRFVRIVREAGEALGFQVVMISHHDEAVFEQYAERIYRFAPTPGGGVEVPGAGG